MVESLFIERAAKEAAEGQIMEGDQRAAELLQASRKAIYHWPADFSGFEAELVFCRGSEVFEGTLKCQGSRKIDISLPEVEDSRWLKYQVEELVAHREAPSVSRMASKTGCSWGDWDETYGRRIDFLGDKMSSFYRLKDEKIMQIGRSYKTQSFVINIDQHQLCCGKYAAQFYSAYYWAKDDSSLKKTETYMDRYENLDGVFIPAERRVTEVADSRLLCRTILFNNPKTI